MALAIEGTKTLPESLQRSQVEDRPNKIVKKSKERKRTKSLDAEKYLEALGSDSTEDIASPESREKKSQGIVIDGKTYTCATCKTGHRVGVCKHARERPMTATHPPGRPPAGAPKKVVCDCPKQCNCKKKDCKCPRQCNCTQMMYMLVYVPAPDEELDADDEKGTWKLGERVTTDLKGNILTAEQIRERQEQKVAQKTQPTDLKTRGSSSAVSDSTVGMSSKSDPKTSEPNCCKHKEVVATRNIAVEASPHSDPAVDAAEGCNCGHKCNCTFCPQHPNNPSSQAAARQQAIFFANQTQMGNQQIQPFVPNLPQGASCMGGIPSFAISRYSSRPTFYDLQRTFPGPGFVIGYPVWSSRIDDDGFSIPPFPMHGNLMGNMGMMSPDGLTDAQSVIGAPQIGQMQEDLSFEFSQDEFSIGNAFVASAGPGGWDNSLVSPAVWPVDSAISTPAINIPETPDFLGHAAGPTELSTTQFQKDVSPSFDFTFDTQNREDNFFDLSAATINVPSTQSPSNVKSCCQPVASDDLDQNIDIFASNYALPVQTNLPP